MREGGRKEARVYLPLGRNRRLLTLSLNVAVSASSLSYVVVASYVYLLPLLSYPAGEGGGSSEEEEEEEGLLKREEGYWSDDEGDSEASDGEVVWEDADEEDEEDDKGACVPVGGPAGELAGCPAGPPFVRILTSPLFFPLSIPSSRQTSSGTRTTLNGRTKRKRSKPLSLPTNGPSLPPSPLPSSLPGLISFHSCFSPLLPSCLPASSRRKQIKKDREDAEALIGLLERMTSQAIAEGPQGKEEEKGEVCGFCGPFVVCISFIFPCPPLVSLPSPLFLPPACFIGQSTPTSQRLVSLSVLSPFYLPPFLTADHCSPRPAQAKEEENRCLLLHSLPSRCGRGRAGRQAGRLDGLSALRARWEEREREAGREGRRNGLMMLLLLSVACSLILSPFFPFLSRFVLLPPPSPSRRLGGRARG